ncbi:tyrosyl-tRNA synthetase [Parelusimicrobium proximum]|uniref:tyrosine--tRNA ligase n=1 Tax=Parelusimicrobium proximum TaxID=3228953 RepID=UPI003D1718AE
MSDPMDLLTRGCVDIVSREELKKKLESGKTLKVKLGADPTSSDLHFGHSVVLNKLRQFQDLGHTAVLVIGDFTASVGDPSGRSSTRPLLSREQILENAKTYTEQVFKILDKNKTEVRFNSEWLDPFVQGKDFLNTLSKVTVSQVLERDDFKKRMSEREPISLLEIMYSIFQGYDSVALKADVELGGTDQIFNLLFGRTMQKQDGQDPQIAMTVPLLVGLDGVKKMSKSYKNYIGLTDAPNDMYGKVMSVSDEMMYNYYELLTSEDMKAVKETHPMQAKKNLAAMMVKRYHGEEAAQAAAEHFVTVFSNKQNPDDMPEYSPENGDTLSNILVKSGCVKSKNEARRLIDQGAVKINGERAEKDGVCELKDGDVLQAGKRHFIKIKK